jgi:hypothetical protein
MRVSEAGGAALLITHGQLVLGGGQALRYPGRLARLCVRRLARRILELEGQIYRSMQAVQYAPRH